MDHQAKLIIPLPQTMPDHSLTYAYLLNKYGLSMTWEEAAKELGGVYWENLRRMCARGDIQAEKVGRVWVLTTKAIADFIDYGSKSKRTPQAAPLSKQSKRGHTKYVSL